jgi:hypothetical protein
MRYKIQYLRQSPEQISARYNNWVMQRGDHALVEYQNDQIDVEEPTGLDVDDHSDG